MHHPLTRILVVDDDPDIRAILREALELAGFAVLEAADGNQALTAIGCEPVGLMIADLVMPEREGLDLIREVRRTRPGIRILAISGAFGGQFLNVAKHLGADITFPKPFDIAAIIRAAGRLLANTEPGGIPGSR